VENRHGEQETTFAYSTSSKSRSGGGSGAKAWRAADTDQKNRSSNCVAGPGVEVEARDKNREITKLTADLISRSAGSVSSIRTSAPTNLLYMKTGRLIVGSKDDAQGFLSSCSWHYVYILRRPEGRPFYVGKGKGSRIFQHENEARHPGNYPKLNVIRAIWKNSGTVQYEIDSVFETAAEAYAREATLILAFKRLHEGGPLTNLAPGGGTDAGISPISKAKHHITLGGVPTDDPDLAIINQYLLSIGDVRSICVKVAARCKVKPTQPYPTKGIGNTSGPNI
jgi:hypothetical protein